MVKLSKQTEQGKVKQHRREYQSLRNTNHQEATRTQDTETTQDEKESPQNTCNWTKVAQETKRSQKSKTAIVGREKVIDKPTGQRKAMVSAHNSGGYEQIAT